MFVVCWQSWRDIWEEISVAMNKAAMMLDWGSSTLDITAAGIVGISHCCMVLGIARCWCWQCLVTVDGNLLPHTVTPLDVTTVAWCCRQTQDVLHPAECPTAALHTSQWQWTASVCTPWYNRGSYSSLFTADKCLQQYHIVVGLLDRYNWQVCQMTLCIILEKLNSKSVHAA